MATKVQNMTETLSIRSGDPSMYEGTTDDDEDHKFHDRRIRSSSLRDQNEGSEDSQESPPGHSVVVDSSGRRIVKHVDENGVEIRISVSSIGGSTDEEFSPEDLKGMDLNVFKDFHGNKIMVPALGRKKTSLILSGRKIDYVVPEPVE
jgi:hypothetical protein